jgi:uracil-DNA glycosylase family 4
MPPKWEPKPYAVQCPGEGDSSAQIAVIGEAPGAAEVRLKTPLVGIFGDIFWTLLTKYAWLDQGQCYADNFCQRRLDEGAKTKLEPREFDFWRESLGTRLASLQPTLVLSIGTLASRALLGDRFDLHVGHGMPFSVGGSSVIPVFHPTSDNLSLTSYDLAQVGKWWRGKRGERDSGSSETRISTLTRPGFIYDSGPLAIDTEYYPSTGEPICFSYTFVTG